MKTDGIQVDSYQQALEILKNYNTGQSLMSKKHKNLLENNNHTLVQAKAKENVQNIRNKTERKLCNDTIKKIQKMRKIIDL